MKVWSRLARRIVAGWTLQPMTLAAFALALSVACVTDPQGASGPHPGGNPTPRTDTPAAVEAPDKPVQLLVGDQEVEIGAVYLTSVHARNRFYRLTVVPSEPHLAGLHGPARLVTPGLSWQVRDVFWPHRTDWGGYGGVPSNHLRLNVTVDSFWACGVTAEEAQTLAGLLDTPASSMLEPTYKLQGELIGKKATYSAGGPILLTLKVTNVGDTHVPLRFGGWQRAANRHHRFDFEVTHRGRLLRNRGTNTGLGGLRTTRSIAPGESFQARVDASKWADFSHPGDYELRVRYRLEVADREPAYDIAPPPNHVDSERWPMSYDDELTATTTITVVE